MAPGFKTESKANLLTVRQLAFSSSSKWPLGTRRQISITEQVYLFSPNSRGCYQVRLNEVLYNRGWKTILRPPSFSQSSSANNIWKEKNIATVCRTKFFFLSLSNGTTIGLVNEKGRSERSYIAFPVAQKGLLSRHFCLRLAWVFAKLVFSQFPYRSFAVSSSLSKSIFVGMFPTASGLQTNLLSVEMLYVMLGKILWDFALCHSPGNAQSHKSPPQNLGKNIIFLALDFATPVPQ